MIEWMQGVAEHVTTLGVPIFLVLYLLVNMLPVPSWPLTVAAGAMFGFGKGVAIALSMNFLGSVGAFLVSRYLLKREMQKIIDRRPKLKAVDDAMREGGWKAVALLQMSPAVPFGLQNYFLGASKVRTSSYLRGTAICGIPSAMAYVGAGAGARWISSMDSGAKWAGLAVGLAATVALSVWIGRIARRRLQGSRPPAAG